MENLKIRIQKTIDEIEQMIIEQKSKEDIENKRKELEEFLDKYLQNL